MPYLLPMWEYRQACAMTIDKLLEEISKPSNADWELVSVVNDGAAIPWLAILKRRKAG